MDIAGVIRHAMEAKGWSRAELARQVGVSRQTVSSWLRNKSAPTRARAPVVAKALNIPLSKISGDPSHLNVADIVNDAVQKKLVPLLDWVDAGRGVALAHTYAFDGEHEFIEPSFNVSDRAFGLEVRGDSMEPDFQSGDIIIVDPSVQPLSGQYVVAEIGKEGTEPGGGDVTFKQYRPRAVLEGFQVFDLVPLNPNYPTITVNKANPGRVIGVVAEHKRNLLR